MDTTTVVMYCKFFTLILFIYPVTLFLGVAECKSSFVPVELRTEYLTNPLTLETVNPRFSWKLVAVSSVAAHNLTQTAYQILVSSSTGALADLWDSGVVKSDSTVHIQYAGKPLKSRQSAVWKVKVWDQNGEMAESATNGQFAIGLLHKSDWRAKWIHASTGLQKEIVRTLRQEDQSVISNLSGLVPPLYFRKSFQIDQIQGARLFATAKGIYEIYVNGKKLQMSHFNPGDTFYDKTIRYQSFENIENHLRKGENVLGVVVGTGWYAGYQSFRGNFALYGSDIGALVQLDVNDHTVVQSDSTWKVATGPIVYSDFYMGETYYVEREMNGWNDVQFNDSQWIQVTVRERDQNVTLIGDVSEPVITADILKPISMHEPEPGIFIFDFGQNFAGVCSLTIHAGQEPTRIQLRHGEALEKPYMKGSLYTANLINARSIDTVVIKDKVALSFNYKPSFTFHGFRFVEVTGYGTKPKLTDIVAHVMHSGIAFNSHMTTSNKMVNRLISNIQWSMRSNFLSVPTDSPQRSERLGYTGDGQVFAPTAVYNADVAAFFTKWMADLRESQAPNGGMYDTAPRFDLFEGSPGWVDAMVIVPWVVYHTYGDERAITDNYEAMAKFINYIRSENPNNLWIYRTNIILGDWLHVNATTEHYVLSTAFYAYDVLLMSKMAAAIGKTEDAKMYSELHQDICHTFTAYFLQPDGIIQGDTQTGYALALAYSLLPEKVRPLVSTRLVDNIKQHNMHLTTGFLGVGLLNPALTESGHNDVAYKLLLQDTYPSWLYPVVHANATTIWERWNVWTEEKGFEFYKSSFNHFALGSVGVWLYQHVAGIASDGAGFKSIIINPNPGPGLTSVNATYESIHGAITSSWTVNGDMVDYTVTIPVNTKATIILPGLKSEHQVGSGTWKFQAKKNF